MDLARISGLKVEELKDFLRLCGLRVTVKKEELVARVFVAVENNVPVQKSADAVQREIAEEYAAKLFVAGNRIPDPLTLTHGWLSEEDSIRYWPVTLYPDIFNFLAFHPNELASTDLSDYKTSKAYSYFSQGWLAPLQFNGINGDSKICLLRGTCRPSQRINDVPHKLWLCLSKESGKIITTHCTCMAGMSQTCNHVAAALFRIESASRMGLNNPSCTSTACQWLPNTKAVEPVKVKDLKLKRDSINKRGKKLVELNSARKRNFNPIAKSNYKLNLNDVAAALKSVCNESDSILFTATPTENSCATSMEPYAFQVDSLETIIADSTCQENFLAKVSEYFTVENVKAVEELTRGQNQNPSWNIFRRHVITASKAHDVKTRFSTLQKASSSKSEIDLTSIFNKISGKDFVDPDLPALRYGRCMENDAVDCFIQSFKKNHKDVTVTNCGLFLYKELPFIGGSPDRIIECSCCGKACLEVKCPFSIRHTTPIDPTVEMPFLRKNEEDIVLNRKHKYFTQCQVQMASADISACYFYVWTPHGSFVEKLVFDEPSWLKMKNTLKEFYVNFYVPHIICSKGST
ncbi:uncharacterized protein LOC135694584 [Rhopilema esculentum]|uniref:uncharacterized protein LOC135694584 n=1 Tax=Rhopilema esculentum TaxID=499914 RepID=UPI0031CF639B